MKQEKVDLTAFPGLLKKLEEKTEAIDRLVSVINELAGYIKNGFSMQPGEVKTFTFGQRVVANKTRCRERVDFKLVKGGFIFFFGTEFDGDAFCPNKLKSKVLVRNPYSSDDLSNFIYDLLPLASEVQKRLEIEIHSMESIKKVLGDSSTQRKKQ
ncbi:MAG: hypothetical protein HGA67_01265 [Candidatus Yonathbacteria bacterium]|nr:hypothetical protein [Candidatus Yonathbacteria bacterium]